MHPPLCRATLTAALAVCRPGIVHAQFVDGASQIPQGAPFNDSNSENVDFADVDLDGDWDAVFADGGGTFFNDDNRVWMNLGHAQGGTLGHFSDETAARFPAVLGQARDIEVVDGDDEADLYISNTSQISPPSNRWWRDNGPAAGTAGFYVDETTARWIGVGGPGSSVPPQAVPASGGFIDWSCDCDFGDLGNDGDLDLVQTSISDAIRIDWP